MASLRVLNYFCKYMRHWPNLGPLTEHRAFTVGTATYWYSISLFRRMHQRLSVFPVGIFYTGHCPCTFYFTWQQVPCFDYRGTLLCGCERWIMCSGVSRSFHFSRGPICVLGTGLLSRCMVQLRLSLLVAGAAWDTSRPENKQKHKKYKRMSKTLNNLNSK